MATFTWARITLCLAAWGGGLSPASTAWAKGKPKILVLPFQHLNRHVPDELGAQATTVITREMGAQGLLAVRSDNVETVPVGTWDGAEQFSPQGDAQAQKKVEAMLVKASEALDDDEAANAIEILDEAVQLMEANAEAVPNLGLLAEIYFQLGVAYFRDGSEDEGDDMLQRAVHFDPERVLKGGAYPPLFVKVYERARYSVLRRGRAAIEIRAPRGARVSFDGRAMGSAPVRLIEALPGQHWIRIEIPNGPIMVKAVRAQAHMPMNVIFPGADRSVSDDNVLSAITRPRIGSAEVAAMQKIGRKARTDLVMFGGVYKTDTAYQIRSAFVSVRNGSVGRLANIAFDLDMLSAEIEVFKLVEDAKAEATTRRFSRPVDAAGFSLAPNLRSLQTIGTRMQEVIAAPPASERPPETLYASRTPATRRPAQKISRLVPKDELIDNRASAKAKVANAPLVPTKEANRAPPPPRLQIGPVPKEEQEERASLTAAAIPTRTVDRADDDTGTRWWLWALVGVAAAGAATAGGVLIANGASSNSEGQVTVTWGGR